MEIQQHDGVVQLVQQFSGRASPSNDGEREELGRGGAAPSIVVCCSPPLTPLYIGGQGQGGRPSRGNPRGGRRPKGEGKGWLAPQARGRPL